MLQERLRINAEKLQALDEGIGRLPELELVSVRLPGRQGGKKHLERLRTEPLDRAGIDDDVGAAMRQKLFRQRRGRFQVKDGLERKNRNPIVIFQFRHSAPLLLHKTDSDFDGRILPAASACLAARLTRRVFLRTAFPKSDLLR